MNGWFEVDRAGLCEIAKRRGMAFVVTEPIQNAWDEATRTVDVQLSPVPGRPQVDIRVEDDSPNGFRDLAESYLLFRQSYKLDNPEQRGRFNVGEKLLLAMALEARVTSTTGSVIFGPNGRRRGRKRTKAGSVLEARLRMTRDELNEALRVAHTLIPPADKATVINGNTLPEREPIGSGEYPLETEVRGDEGGFRYVTRKTSVRLYKPLPGEQPHVYEMGIPIDEVGCPWHVNVGQKIPLALDRGSVRVGYVLSVERIAAEIMAERMNRDEARDGWVSRALPRMKDDAAVRRVIKKRFGKAVIYDPSSPESNKRALDAGYHVVRGGELSKDAWMVVRRAEALKPAGRVFKIGIPVSPDGQAPEPHESWTRDMRRFAKYAAAFSLHVTGEHAEVNFYRLDGRNALGFCRGREIGINLSSGGVAFIKEATPMRRWDELLIHECAHFKVADHLTDAFHAECCRIGARLRTFYTHPWECDSGEDDAADDIPF